MSPHYGNYKGLYLVEDADSRALFDRRGNIYTATKPSRTLTLWPKDDQQRYETFRALFHSKKASPFTFAFNDRQIAQQEAKKRVAHGKRRVKIWAIHVPTIRGDHPFVEYAYLPNVMKALKLDVLPGIEDKVIFLGRIPGPYIDRTRPVPF